MKNIATAVLVVAWLAPVAWLKAQDAPKQPAPEKEHQWLAQLVGEWDTEAEAVLEPGKPPLKCQGTESVRAIGGFWTVSVSQGTFMDVPTTGVLTLGYDPQKKKYVGTWIDSMTNYLWKYEGSLDESGKVLTLETEGPNPVSPGKLAKFKEVLEIKDKDHKVFTSSLLGEDGKWATFVTVNYQRKK
jgi:hypothetical protein